MLSVFVQKHLKIIDNNEIKNKKALVMGLGLYEKGSGISAIKFYYPKVQILQ